MVLPACRGERLGHGIWTTDRSCADVWTGATTLCVDVHRGGPTWRAVLLASTEIGPTADKLGADMLGVVHGIRQCVDGRIGRIADDKCVELAAHRSDLVQLERPHEGQQFGTSRSDRHRLFTQDLEGWVGQPLPEEHQAAGRVVPP